jgi:hemolysin activation/secretion protein
MFQIGGHTGQRKTMSTNTNTIIYGYECTVQLHATNRNLFFQSKFLSAGTFGATFYDNEAPRIGGMNSIRGYFEESISAFHYALVQSNFGRRFGNSFSTYITTDFAQIIQPQQRQIGSFGIGTTLQQNNSSVALSFAWPFERGIAFEASNARLGIQFNTYF